MWPMIGKVTQLRLDVVTCTNVMLDDGIILHGIQLSIMVVTILVHPNVTCLILCEIVVKGKKAKRSEEEGRRKEEERRESFC